MDFFISPARRFLYTIYVQKKRKPILRLAFF